MKHVEIKYLSDCPEFIPVVVDWIYKEFIEDIRFGISNNQVSDSYSICYKNKLPVRLIAISDDVCVGTVSLVNNDLKSRNYTPWLAALYVDPTFRGNKIAELLICRIKEIAIEMGYKELFLRTEFAADYYKKRNWDFVESCVDEFNLTTEVFKVDFI